MKIFFQTMLFSILALVTGAFLPLSGLADNSVYYPENTIAYIQWSNPSLEIEEVLDGFFMQKTVPAVVQALSTMKQSPLPFPPHAVAGIQAMIKPVLLSPQGRELFGNQTSVGVFADLPKTVEGLSNADPMQVLGDNLLIVIQCKDGNPQILTDWVQSVSTGIGVPIAMMQEPMDNGLVELALYEKMGEEMGEKVFSLYAASKGNDLLLGLSPSAVQTGLKVAAGKNLAASPRFSQALSELDVLAPEEEVKTRRELLFINLQTFTKTLEIYYKEMADELSAELEEIGQPIGQTLAYMKDLEYIASSWSTLSQPESRGTIIFRLSPELMKTSGLAEAATADTSMHRSSDATMSWWFNALNSTMISTGLQSLPTEDLQEINAQVEQELGMNLDRLLNTFGPQVEGYIDFLNTSMPMGMPIPSLRFSVQVKDKESAYALFEKALQGMENQGHEQAKPAMRLEGESVHVTWPQLADQLGLYPVLTYTPEAIHLALRSQASNSALPMAAPAQIARGTVETWGFHPSHFLPLYEQYKGLITMSTAEGASIVEVLTPVMKWLGTFTSITGSAHIDANGLGREHITILRDFSVAEQKEKPAAQQ